MPACSDVTLAGEHVQLLAGRALHWPARRLLAIADLHLGKDDVFRSAGISIPAGGTQADLARLSSLLDSTQATRLLVLGDFIHGLAGAARWRETWCAFRQRHDVIVQVVLGNHDRGLDAAGLEIDVVGDGLSDGPFRFAHAHEGGQAGLCISGHVHPVVRLPALGASFPVFHLQAGGLVLPAFSAMTGGWKVSMHDAWMACVHDHLMASPALLAALPGHPRARQHAPRGAK